MGGFLWPGLAAVATSALAPLCLDGSFVVGPGVARAPQAPQAPQGPAPSVPLEMNGPEGGTRTEIWIVGPPVGWSVLKIYQFTNTPGDTSCFYVFIQLMWVFVCFFWATGPRKSKHLDPEGV